MKKLNVFATSAVALLLTACGGAASNDTTAPVDNTPAVEKTTISIAATAVPHYEILQEVKPILEEMGYTLDIREVDDFVTPNLFLNDGDVDANFFQHYPFLANFNEVNEATLTPVFAVHFEPLKIYAGRLDDLNDIPAGITVALPDDPTNLARGLQLLEAQGLLTLRADAGLTATELDIDDNPFDISVVTAAGPALPALLPDVDFAVINGNFALQGGITDRGIDGSGEDVNSEAAETFANLIVVREEDKGASWVTAIIEAMQDDAIKTFILDSYEGRVEPILMLP